MNNRIVLVAAIVAMSLPLTDAAFGQGGHPGNSPGRNEQGAGGNQGRQAHRSSPPGPSRKAAPAHRDQKPPTPSAFSRDRRQSPRDVDNRRSARRGGPDQDIHRGKRLPSKYRHEGNVVHDWRGHRLSRPPRGHYWMRTGPDFVLVAISSGIIARILLSR